VDNQKLFTQNNQNSSTVTPSIVCECHRHSPVSLLTTMAPSSSSNKNKTVNLHLDADEDAPRRLLLLPSGELLAYGGDDGIITCLTTSDKNDNDASIIQRYDDGVRAVAVSKDGKRVAVGFDDGRTQLYSFDDYDADGADKSKPSHPFCQAASQKSSNEEDALFSQDLNLQETIPSIAGPSFDSPIRDLQFHPTQQYALAIASEATVCVVDATDSTTMATRHLQHQAEHSHDHCGIRGVSFGDDGLLCTLAMDGRLCVWLAQGPPATWKLLEREAQTCIPKKDVGEILGASVADRSCRPLISVGYIATPGNVQVQLRKIVRLNNTTSLEKVPPSSDDGHVESIVCLARSNEWLVTSGRDGKILVWKISSEGLSLETTLASDLESMPTDLMIQDNHTVYAVSANGSCVLLELPKSSSDTMEQERVVRLQTKKEERKRLSKQVKTASSSSKDQTPDNDDDDDSDVDFADAASPTSKVRFIEEDAIEDVDADDLDETANPNNTATRRGDGLDRDDVDGDDFANDDDDDFDEHRPYISPHQYSAAPTIPPQAAFAPSSTPLDLDRRFLCWNHVGTVTLLHGEDNTRNTVDISFTDSAFRRPISFTDNINFILGSLGEDGGIFASDLQQEEEEHDDEMDEIVGDLNVSERTKSLLKKSQRKRMNKDPNKPMGSSIFFYRFETFGSLRDKDWYLTLPDGERVMGSACGEGWAGVVTR
jgi:WD40 repeat protein